MRLDAYLYTNNYFESRSKALREIKNNNILVNDIVINKPSYIVNEEDIVKVLKDNTLKYVSQGALKLEGAIKDFNLDFNDSIVLDIGASTGGFTDCALNYGAKKVYAVDVGTNQLHEKLLNDSRVISYENTNILELIEFEDNIDIIVTDVSFISIKHILSALKYYFNTAKFAVILIKPQFEIGKIKIKNGIVKDKKLVLNILDDIYNTFYSEGLYINSISKSKQLGKTGNQEYVALVTKNLSVKPDFKAIIN